MKTWVRKTLSVGVLAAGALLFGSGAAHADTGQHSWDNNGIANGTQVVAPINAVTNVTGIGVGILGEGTGSGAAVGGWTEHGTVKQNSSDNNGILNGTQIYLPVDLATNVAGVGVGVLGEGTGSGVAASGHSTESATTESGKVKQDSSDNNGILNGTQIYLPIDAATNIAGVGLGILGEGTGSGAAVSGRSTESGKVKQDSSDNNGIANGTQVYAPVTAVTNVAGVGLGILGEGTGSGAVISGQPSTEGAEQASSDNNGIANGTQVIAPITAVTNVCGVGIGVLGEGTGEALCVSGGSNGGDHGDNDGDHGDGGDHPDDNAGDEGDDEDYGDAPRSARKAATEAGPVDSVTGVTQGVNSDGGLLGGLLGGLR
jgi:hypothetical protein